jgi:hypothetical protein
MSEPSVGELLLDQLREVKEKADRVPVLEAEVKMLQDTVGRLINVITQVGVGILVTGVLTVIAALILKGVIG